MEWYTLELETEKGRAAKQIQAHNEYAAKLRFLAFLSEMNLFDSKDFDEVWWKIQVELMEV